MNFKLDFLTRSASRVTIALAMIAIFSVAAEQADAQNNYEVNISSSDRFLMSLNTSMETIVAQEEMCDNPNNRIQNRNRPAVRVDNAATSNSDLTSFTLRIAADDYLFGTGDNAFDNFNGNPIRVSAYNMPGIEILGATITDVTNQGSENGTDKLLTVNFSGLAPGEHAIFNIDIDTSNASEFQLPDFRGVLFGSDVGSGITVPAYHSANFADNVNVAETQFVTPDTAIPYTGMNVRPYQAMDPIVPFGGSGGGAIPEPTSLVLLGVGLAGLSRVRRRV
ncbi:MAG: PEP-CTERM sorting domain-containing protein [Lacipirellulaceae bacterium]